ncbi:glycosyltransferase [Carboxylicivirga sp. M1479]|uniref:glycosyltransferase n=1 Tax=Carboxylicivirga sp. M1479 TaxID=2594476 RepID=UPI002101D60A|nr:glycosyltransferase [Carboxylicivirga sp. M1479]
MLNLAFFSHSNISPSETFIYDLVEGLSLCTDVSVNYVSGKREVLHTNLKINKYTTGYSDKYQVTALRLHKLGQIKGAKGDEWQMRFIQRVALRQLKNTMLPNFDVAYVEYATSGVLVMDYLQLQQIPFVVHVHGYDITTCLNDKAYVKELKRLFALAQGFIAASHYMKRRLILLGCDENKIKVIRLGVSSKGIVPLNWDTRKLQNPSIVYLGRFTEKKHPMALLYAFRIVKNKIPNATLTMIGGGPLEKEVKQLITQLSLEESVALKGVLSREFSFPILNKHWIYAQHSVTSVNGDTEGFAISLAEAALHELPVVSTYHNGIPENVIDGKTGLLVKEYDYEAMAEKIILLIENPDIAEKMGKAGRNHILQLCEPKKRIKEIKELLYQVANNNLIK